MEEEPVSSPPASLRPPSPLSFISETPDTQENRSIQSVADGNSSILSDISEALDEIPVFETDHSLLNWLKAGKEQLKRLMENLKPAGKSGRGPYFKSRIGGVPSERTSRLHRAEDKKQKAAHGDSLMGWLGKGSRATTEQRNTPDATAEPNAEQPMTIDLVSMIDPVAASATDHGHRHVVTVEEVDEEEDIESLSPSEREEEWLGDLEEIFAGLVLDPGPSTSFAQSTTPSPSASVPPVPGGSGPSLQTPNSQASRQYTPGTISFAPADESFVYTPTEQPAGPPGRPPSAQKVDAAISKLNNILHPSRGPNTSGYKSVEMNRVLLARLELMLSFLRLYASGGYTAWPQSADIVAKSAGKGSWLSRRIREWTVNFIKDDENLPTAEYGKMNGSVLEDEDLAQELHLHLQGIGKHVAAQDIGISLATAQRWMKRMEFRWTKEPKGMYSDGHEREDVVAYRQNIFLPQWAALSRYTRKFTEDGDEIGSPEADAAKTAPKKRKKSKQREIKALEELWDDDEVERAFIAGPDGRIVGIWRHEECIFYANDRRKIRWVHASEKAKPYAKGEGASMMVAAFVSEHGWLARWTFRPGGKQDGYYTNAKILEHATEAMDTLDQTRPHECHVFAYDNATTHTARAPDALSARRMVVKPPTSRSKTANFLCAVNTPNGVEYVRMRDGTFPDGTRQSLYFPEGHAQAGIFKGMRILIHERINKGATLPNPDKLKAECKGFKCLQGNQTAAYRKGLDGIQAVWASKRYRGHRVLPKNIMQLFDKFFKKQQ
ncbi:hypothetical protein B0H13DRAFT_2312578 [Mycena leptocephala]|nr:hypothetical protein B0H13DRAFT_2312578 [Mycena leptocephala]